jgi:hypothetical protein
MVQQRGEPRFLIPSRHLTHTIQPAWRIMPGTASGMRCAGRVPLGRSPFLHHLRSRFHGLVQQLRGTTGPSDFPRSYIPGLPPQRSLSGPPGDQPDGQAAGSPGSRAGGLRTCTGSQTARGPPAARASAAGDVAFRLVRRRRHPGAVISRLNGWPARTPANASPSPSRAPTHDSGPSRIATPSMSGALIPFLPPVYPGAPHVPRGSGRPGSRRLHAGHHLASRRASARLIPGRTRASRF